MDVSAFEQIPLFQGFSRQQLEEVAKLAISKSFADGATVLAQGDFGRHFLIILNGRAEVIWDSKNGERVLIAELQQGDFFGERAAIRSGSRTANVVARGNLECAILTQWDVLAVLRADQANMGAFLERLRSRYLLPE